MCELRGSLQRPSQVRKVRGPPVQLQLLRCKPSLTMCAAWLPKEVPPEEIADRVSSWSIRPQWHWIQDDFDSGRDRGFHVTERCCLEVVLPCLGQNFVRVGGSRKRQGNMHIPRIAKDPLPVSEAPQPSASGRAGTCRQLRFRREPCQTRLGVGGQNPSQQLS